MSEAAGAEDHTVRLLLGMISPRGCNSAHGYGSVFGCIASHLLDVLPSPYKKEHCYGSLQLCLRFIPAISLHG
jgi:hypothetical protein